MAFSKYLSDLKAYYKIQSVYPRRYRGSVIESYIVNEAILGNEVIIKKNVYLNTSLNKIGNYTYIGANTSVYNCASIGNYCSISHGVKIGLENHALDHIGTSPVFYSHTRKWLKESTIERDKPVTIGHDVLISANAMILSGVSIGTGAVVGAGAFVNKDVPPYAIVAGMPAKIIRYRFDDETIEKIMKTEWWLRNKKELIGLSDVFSNVPAFINTFNQQVS